MYLIVGLGNPGLKYRKTPHNAGFMALDELAAQQKVRFSKSAFEAQAAELFLGGEKVLLLKPQTFMNLSGRSVAAAARYYNIPPEHIVVVYDDKDMALGKLRIRDKGSAGGHNGIKNIIAHLGTDVFPRVKVGVGAPSHPDYDMVDWVIGSFSAQEKKIVDEALDRALDAAECIISRGVTEAQNRFN